MKLRVFVAVAVFVSAGALTPATALAAFPGTNGKIAFSDTRDDPNGEIYTINPDGTGVTRFTTSGAPDVKPAWSNNGQKIVWNKFDPDPQVWIMNWDGTGQGSLGSGLDPSWSADDQWIVFVSPGECGAGTGGIWKMTPTGTSRTFIGCGPPGLGEDGEGDPVWSPDGGLIAFGADLAEFDIFTMNSSDGTGRVNLTESPNDIDRNANWSPDAQKIAWGRDDFTGEEIWTMNRDGTGQAQLIPSGTDPAYSPDGTKIVVDGLTVYNSDGTGGTHLTNGLQADWQPIPITGYPRPKGAFPLSVSLVPAFDPCSSSNRTHGPPLVFPSCAPPAQTSSAVTVGTPDAGGGPANSSGRVAFKVIVGVPGPPEDSDVILSTSISDVRCAAVTTCGSANSGGGADYTGEIAVETVIRITDKWNSGGNLGGTYAATVRDMALGPAKGTCVNTASLSAGGTCTINTTFNAMIPGSIKDGKRATFAMDQIRAFDGGPDGDADTPGNALFMTQGVFVP